MRESIKLIKQSIKLRKQASPQASLSPWSSNPPFTPLYAKGCSMDHKFQ